MGIGCDAITLLTELTKACHITKGGAVMEIGAQQLANSFLEAREELTRLAALLDVTTSCQLPPPSSTHRVHGTLQHLNAAAPPARDFWHWLGFSYASIDIDGSPGKASPLP